MISLTVFMLLALMWGVWCSVNFPESAVLLSGLGGLGLALIHIWFAAWLTDDNDDDLDVD